MSWGNSPNTRYEVLVEIGDDWYTMPTFGTVEGCVNWMGNYDPDGTVPMKVRDAWEDRILGAEELFGKIPQPEKEEPRGDWKKEGF